MFLYQAIESYLKSLSALTQIVGTKIYQDVAPETTIAPWTVISMISGSNIPEISVGIALVQLSNYSKSKGQAETMLEIERQVFKGFSGTMGGINGVKVNKCYISDERHDYENDTGLFTTQLDININYWIL